MLFSYLIDYFNGLIYHFPCYQGFETVNTIDTQDNTFNIGITDQLDSQQGKTLLILPRSLQAKKNILDYKGIFCVASLINRSNRGFPKLDGGYLLPINTKWLRINIYETLPPWQLTVHVNILLSIIGTFVSIYHEH